MGWPRKFSLANWFAYFCRYKSNELGYLFKEHVAVISSLSRDLSGSTRGLERSFASLRMTEGGKVQICYSTRMTLALISFGIFTVLELALWIKPIWQYRRITASVTLLGLSVSIGFIFGLKPSIWTGLFLIFGVYRMINLLRIIEGRSNADHLYKVARNSSLLLISAQIILLLVTYLFDDISMQTSSAWYLLACSQLIAAIFIFSVTKRNLRLSTAPKINKKHSDKDLPTVTVAIPARNETEDLKACLQTLVATDYPKLEIIVLDDCSQDKQIPEIIKDFAHDGVRFLQGQVPPERWLAKNYAYQQLYEAANGEVLLFCGVDTRFEPASIRQMIELMMQKNKNMVSLIPVNKIPGKYQMENLFVQPGRYSWELALPRRFLNRPPVLSTCWLITKDAINAAGTFKAISHSNSPESFFARYTALHQDAYSFMISDKSIGLRSIKSFNEQRATAIRTRYPQVHRRPEIVAVLSIAIVSILVIPFLAFWISIYTANWSLALGYAITCAFLIGFYFSIVKLTYRKALWRGVWLLPFAAIYDIGLLNYSMWQYEFREVIWKDRNVCVPIMRTYPKLPDTK